jgi:hypothetical protein
MKKQLITQNEYLRSCSPFTYICIHIYVKEKKREGDNVTEIFEIFERVIMRDLIKCIIVEIENKNKSFSTHAR